MVWIRIHKECQGSESWDGSGSDPDSKNGLMNNWKDG